MADSRYNLRSTSKTDQVRPDDTSLRPALDQLEASTMPDRQTNNVVAPVIDPDAIENLGSVHSNASSIRRRQLELQIQEREALVRLERHEAEIRQRTLEHERELIKMRFEAEQLRLTAEGSRHSRHSSRHSMVSQRQHTQQWVNNLNIQKDKHTNELVPKELHPAILNDNEDNMFRSIIARKGLKIDIQPFSGDPLDWPLFISQFKETTQFCKFSDAENIARLRQCLKGKAKDAVKALLITPSSIPEILKILELRFGRPELIIRNLTKDIQNKNSINEGDTEAFLEFASLVSNLVVTIENLNAIQHLSNPNLLESLILKLPVNLRFNWGEYLVNQCNEIATLLDFKNWVMNKATIISYINIPSNSDNDNTKLKDMTEKNNDTNQYSKLKNKTRTKFCFLCKMTEHDVSTCNKFVKMNIDERWNVISKAHRCFSCLGGQHRTSDCKRKARCKETGCLKNHHPLLHKENSKTETKTNNLHKSTSQTLLKICPVKLSGPEGSIDTTAIFDEGSTITMIEDDMAQKLGLNGPNKPLIVQWTNDIIHEEQDSKLVNLQISGPEIKSKQFKIKNVRTVKSLGLPFQKINLVKLKEAYPYLNKHPVYSVNTTKPTMLIGQDNWPLIISREIIQGPNTSDPALSKTLLGWVVHGNVNYDINTTQICTVHMTNTDDDLYNLIKESIVLDSIGVTPRTNPLNMEDSRAVKIANETTHFVDNRWETGLLWKDNDKLMPETKFTALKRLYCLERKLDKDPLLAQRYCARLDQNIKSGYARKLSNDEIKQLSKSKRLWYLPHLAVINPNKPEKLRVVFDASAKSNGLSLNDHLLKGPDKLNNIPGMLMKFRQYSIGFCADIKEMYPQIKIIKKDQNAQLYLWRGMRRDISPDIYVNEVMLFGAICSPFSAQFVRDKNADQYSETKPGPVSAIKNKHYMDDYVDSAPTVESAVNKINDIIEIHKKGGFQICQWVCSDKNVIAKIPEELKSDKLKNLTITHERVLGLYWDHVSDYFNFEFRGDKLNDKLFKNSTTPTKREICKAIMLIFDPLGFLTPIMIKGKLLLQETWKLNIDWDKNLPESLSKSWLLWLQEVRDYAKLKINRCYSPLITSSDRVEAHIFCDASDRMYIAVAYFRIVNAQNITTTFIAAKSKIAPLKPLSIPRKELQAALLASRLGNFIKENHEFKISKFIFWSDSKIVLSWIKSEAIRFKTYVGLRVGEIQEITDPSWWRWVPTELNVADIATRNIDIKLNDDNSKKWFMGPKFLSESEENWPQPDKNVTDDKITEVELKKDKTEFVGLSITNKINLIEVLPNIKRFSKWLRFIRATAWVLKFTKICRKTDNIYPDLTTDDLNEAEVLCCKLSQQDSFKSEIAQITKNQTDKTNRLEPLSPIIGTDGLIRMKGRLGRAAVAANVKQPIILDPKHRFTQLLLHHYHCQMGHQGQDTVLNEIRQKYWILSSRQAIRKTWKDCMQCKIGRAVPSNPEMADLPDERLAQYQRPFSHIGMDYFGPLEITVNKRREKRYGVLFTCLTTRAVHLELASSLSADSALMALRRLAARRGCPVVVWSDNGTNMKGAERQLRESLAQLDQSQMTRDLAVKGITWKFIPPMAPHMGGSWERLIRSVKIALSAILRDRAPREEVLGTFLVEAENIINSRPLTHVSLDSKDEECLTPNSILIGTSSSAGSWSNFKEEDFDVKKQWRIGQRLADMFWRRWVREYLPTINRRDKWRKEHSPIQEGDVVIVAEANLARNAWIRGVVEHLVPGRDGRCRVVDIRTSSGLIRRPVVRVAVLDVRQGPEDVQE